MDSEEWNRRYDTTELVWTAEPNRFLVAEAGTLPAGSALDLGAGEGRNAVWLAQQGWQVTAVDFAQAGLAKAAKLAATAEVNVSTVCADLTTYTPPLAIFDLVIVLYLHLPAPQRQVIHRLGRRRGRRRWGPARGRPRRHQHRRRLRRPPGPRRPLLT